MPRTTATMTVQLPAEIKERLEELARATSQPESVLAAEAISSYVDLREWQIRKIEQGLREAQAGEFASDEEVAAFFSDWLDAN